MTVTIINSSSIPLPRWTLNIDWRQFEIVDSKWAFKIVLTDKWDFGLCKTWKTDGVIWDSFTSYRWIKIWDNQFLETNEQEKVNIPNYDDWELTKTFQETDAFISPRKKTLRIVGDDKILRYDELLDINIWWFSDAIFVRVRDGNEILNCNLDTLEKSKARIRTFILRIIWYAWSPLEDPSLEW